MLDNCFKNSKSQFWTVVRFASTVLQIVHIKANQQGANNEKSSIELFFVKVTGRDWMTK